VEKGSALTLRDARASRKYGAGNPVIREHGYITYTGVPVRAPAGVPEEGEIIGTLCVTDLGPRNWVMADVEEMHERAAALARSMYELGASQL
jgi:hypothetical protein